MTLFSEEQQVSAVFVPPLRVSWASVRTQSLLDRHHQRLRVHHRMSGARTRPSSAAHLLGAQPAQSHTGQSIKFKQASPRSMTAEETRVSRPSSRSFCASRSPTKPRPLQAQPKMPVPPKAPPPASTFVQQRRSQFEVRVPAARHAPACASPMTQRRTTRPPAEPCRRPSPGRRQRGSPRLRTAP